MSKTNAGNRNQDREDGQHLVAGLAGVIAACRDVRSGETIAQQLLDVSRGSQLFIGTVDEAQRAVVFVDTELVVLEFPFGLDGLEDRPVNEIEVDTPRAEVVRAEVGPDRIDWLTPRFRTGSA